MGLLGSVKSFAGEFVDMHAHMAGAVLDFVGMHDAAHAVDKWGDGIADDLGAAVGELNLGESDDPKELVHGDVKAIGETVKHLVKFAAAFEETAGGLSRLDSEHWQGQAADAFRKKFSGQPTAWRVTADACEAAAKALEALGGTITWAQGQAQQAIDAYKKSEQATRDAQDAYNRQAGDYNHALKAYQAAGDASATAPTKPAEFHDPGAAVRKQAAELLLTARKQRVGAADTAEQAIKAATAHAPHKPGLMDRLGMALADAPDVVATSVLHVEGGLVKGAADAVKFGRGLNPYDTYNITHPALYLDHLNSVAGGLVHTGNHPTELASALVGSGWGSDPAEAGGKTLFNLVTGVATGGGSEAAVVAEREAAGVAENAARQEAERAAQQEAERAAAKASHENAFKPKEGPWRPDTQANYPSYHEGSLSPEQAQALIDQEFPWMNDINKPRWDVREPGYTKNCTNNVVTVDRRLDGIEVDTAPREGGRTLEELQDLYRNERGDPDLSFHQVDGYDRISEDIAARGPGARGAVVIARSDGTGHVFNVINSNGRVIYLDGQTGRLAQLEPDLVDLKYMPY